MLRHKPVLPLLRHVDGVRVRSTVDFLPLKEKGNGQKPSAPPGAYQGKGQHAHRRDEGS